MLPKNLPIGTKIKILANNNNHEYPIGSIQEINGYDIPADQAYLCKKGYWVLFEDAELIVDLPFVKKFLDDLFVVMFDKQSGLTHAMSSWIFWNENTEGDIGRKRIMFAGLIMSLFERVVPFYESTRDRGLQVSGSFNFYSLPDPEEMTKAYDLLNDLRKKKEKSENPLSPEECFEI